MKSNWVTRKFGDTFKLSSGTNLTVKKIVKGDYPVYGGNGIMGYHNTFNFSGNYIIIGRVGALCGNVRSVSGDFWLTDNAFRIEECNDNFNNKYLEYYLNYLNLRQYAREAVHPVISNSSLKNIEIFYPKNTEEQQKIVEKLDKAFELIDQAKANIEQNIINAKELFQSKLDEVFSGNTTNLIRKKFEDICILQRGYDLPKKDRYEGEYELVSSNGVTDYISEYKVVGPGVITGRSGTIGKVHFIENNYWPLNTALYIKDFKGNVPKYIYYFLQSINLSIYASGAGVPTLNRNFVHSEYFTITEDIDMQIQSIRVLDDLQENIKYIVSKYQQKLSNLEELRKSILEKTFKGELTH